MDLLNTLVDKGLRRETPTRDEALAVLATTDDELLDVVAAAGKVRRHWFGRRVKLNYLVNLKSGLCPRTAPTAPSGSARRPTSSSTRG